MLYEASLTLALKKESLNIAVSTSKKTINKCKLECRRICSIEKKNTKVRYSQTCIYKSAFRYLRYSSIK